MIRIVSYGTLHQDPPPGDALLVDLTRLLRNPHADPAMRELTGRDAVVRDHVLATLGATDVVDSVVARVEALLTYHQPRGEDVRVHVQCKGGRHRSVAVADAAGAALHARGHQVAVEHRHVDLPVVQLA